MEIFILVLVLASSIWVGLDAKQLGIRKGNSSGVLDAGPFGWFCCTLLLWIIAFPLYLASRSRLKLAAQEIASRPKQTPRTDLELQREADARAQFLAQQRRQTPPPTPSVASEASQAIQLHHAPGDASPPPESSLSTTQLLQEILATQRQTAATLREIRNAIAAAIIIGTIAAILLAIASAA
jgi:hypothetical protein